MVMVLLGGAIVGTIIRNNRIYIFDLDVSPSLVSYFVFHSVSQQSSCMKHKIQWNVRQKPSCANSWEFTLMNIFVEINFLLGHKVKKYTPELSNV